MPDQAFSPISGYENRMGSKKSFVGELYGQLSYTTGGQVVNASQFGWGGFDIFDAGSGLSYSGTYYCRVQYMPVSGAPSKLSPGGNQQVKVIWIVTATGAEVANTTNISGEVIRIFALGV